VSPPGATAGQGPAPRVLVATGGLIHLVHQLAVVQALPELQARSPGPAPPIAVVITGVLTKDPLALASVQAPIERWIAWLRQHNPKTFAGLHQVTAAEALQPGEWDLACLNNQWLKDQRRLVQRLGIGEVVVCGDGLGLYYRCPRELRALAPSLLGLPIREAGARVRYVLSGRQPRWHRPPIEPTTPPLSRRLELFGTLLASEAPTATSWVRLCQEASGPGRPIWLCSVPNLAHQFPRQRIPATVLDHWRQRLEQRHGFVAARDRLVLLDHPKAPPAGSFGPLEAPWLAGPLRAPVPLEVLVELLRQANPDRQVVVTGLTSALYGVRALTDATVVWLPLGPLWRSNPRYRRKPLEFLHRWLRVRRMQSLTAQLAS